MQLQLANGIVLFLPVIFPSKEILAHWPSLKLLHLLELIFIIAMCPGSILLVYNLRKSIRLFHRNLIRVAQVHLVALTVSQITRILILFYESGLWERKGSFDGVVFILIFVRYVSLCCLVTIIPAVVAERALASHYISDYESNKRRWISVMVNAGSLLISTLYYVLIQLITFSLYAMVFLMFITLMIFLLSSLAIMMVFRRDAAKLRDLSNETGRSTLNYTLSMKYQLSENVRVAKLLTYAAMSLSIWGTCSSSLTCPAYMIFGEEKPISQVLYAISNVFIALSLAVAVWLSLAAIGEVKRMYKHSYKYLCCMSRKAKQKLIYPATALDTQTKTENHFTQLRSAWKTIS